ncbi:MAG: DUF4468 domain-containing protein [Hymenobacter sp.]|nr:MAG: DUF4468 domain-containing protein [Hymenobacter sp.]
MKTLLTLLLLAPAGACFAQADYTYLLDAPTKLGDEAVPAYRTLADTTGKPFTKLFAHSNVAVTGRLGTRWAVVKKADTEYIIRTSDLPAAGQQVVAAATALKPIPFDATGHIVYTEVVQVPGATQAELYARAKLWFVDTFKSAKDVVQAEEKEAGVIQGTGYRDIAVMSMGIPNREKLWYTVKIAVKDGRYKYDVTNFRVQLYPNQSNPNPGEPGPAERSVSTDQKKGVFLSIARSTRREVTVAGNSITNSITGGMSKPATGSDF